MIFYKSAGETISFPIYDTGTFAAVSFEVSCDAAGQVLIIENQDGEIYRTPLQQGRAAYSADIAGSDSLRFTIADADGAGQVPAVFNLYYGKDSLQ